MLYQMMKILCYIMLVDVLYPHWLHENEFYKSIQGHLIVTLIFSFRYSVDFAGGFVFFLNFES